MKLSAGELEKLADLQRKEELKRKIEESARPLFHEIRELILRKCKAEKAKQLRPIFEKEPFGETERVITQKLLDVAKGVALLLQGIAEPKRSPAFPGQGRDRGIRSCQHVRSR